MSTKKRNDDEYGKGMNKYIKECEDCDHYSVSCGYCLHDNICIYKQKKVKPKQIKFDRIEYIKNWFTFPLCFDIQPCYYRCDVRTELVIHFLFWHARIYFMRKENYDSKI